MDSGFRDVMALMAMFGFGYNALRALLAKAGK
jgi:hypothetical protein